MKYSKPDDLKHLLLNCAKKFEGNPDYLQSDSAFSRKGKISFEQAILFPILSQKDNLRSEIANLFPEDNLPSPSAMTQKRSLIFSDLFRDLFHAFSNALPHPNKYKGYRIFACDGTRLNLQYNPKDPETFIQNIKDRKGCNQMHITALFDVLNDIYTDVEFDYGNSMDERRAFCSMVDRYESEDKPLFICDRGFTSFNTSAHVIHNGQNFLFRISSSIDISKFIDPDIFAKEQFDQSVDVAVSKSKKNRKKYDNFQYISSQSTYDYLESGSQDIDMLHIRFVKIQVNENTTEYLATNLPRSISIDDLKELYHLRWGIETSFRHLKYAADLIYIHSLKKDLTLQEIYGKLILFNFSFAVEKLADGPISSHKSNNKHEYSINKTQAVKYCVMYLKGMIINLIEVIRRSQLPNRPARHFDRNLRRQAAESFGYR